MIRVQALLVGVCGLAACAETRFPLLVHPALVNESDMLAKQAIEALVQRDAKKLAELELSKEAIANALKPDRLAFQNPPVLHFLGDGLIGPDYFRQYCVAVVGSGKPAEIRFWFRRAGTSEPHAFLTGIQFMDQAETSKDSSSK